MATKKKCGGMRRAVPRSAGASPGRSPAEWALWVGADGSSTCYVNKPSGKLFAGGGCPFPPPLPSRRPAPPAPLDTTSLADGRKTKPCVVLAVPAGCSLLAAPEVPRPRAKAARGTRVGGGRRGRPGRWQQLCRGGTRGLLKLFFSPAPVFGARCRTPQMSAAGTGRSPPVWCRMAARPGGCLSPREKHFFKVIPAWGRVLGGAGREMQASWVELVMSFLVPATVPSKSALGVCLGGRTCVGAEESGRRWPSGTWGLLFRSPPNHRGAAPALAGLSVRAEGQDHK